MRLRSQRKSRVTAKPRGAGLSSPFAPARNSPKSFERYLRRVTEHVVLVRVEPAGRLEPHGVQVLGGPQIGRLAERLKHLQRLTANGAEHRIQVVLAGR
jgi:hypothetical protein